jgi:GNAT superfamily N-acetyltransferase
MTEIGVARLTHSDREDWLSLFQEWQRYMSSLPLGDNVHDRTWRLLVQQNSGLMGLIARDAGGRRLGFAHVSLTPFAWAGGPIMYLQDLFVTETARKSGVGATLLREVYKLADEIGVAQVFWLVDQEDAPLSRFYDRYAVRTHYIRFMRHRWPWYAEGQH